MSSGRESWKEIAAFSLGLAALALASYLHFWEGSHNALPGCGTDEACGTVLGSRWARWGPISLAILGVAAYTVFSLLGALDWWLAGKADRMRDWIGSGLVVMAVVGIGFIFWLILLQWVVIRHFCIFCLSDHALGFSAFALTLYSKTEWRVMKTSVWKHLAVSFPGLLFIVMVHIFIVPDQMVVRAAPAERGENAPAQLEGGSLRIGRKVESRMVEFLGGDLPLDTYKFPLLGDPRADKVMLMLFDYNCPNCRKLENFLKQIDERYGPGKVAIVCLPVPMEKDCNPDVVLERPEFENSCLYTELAMAVCKADRRKFRDFHFWMMEGRWAPSPREAERKAAELVGADALAEARSDAQVRSWITDGLNVYRYIEGKSIPKLIIDEEIISVRIGTAARFFQELEEMLGIEPLED